MSQSHSNLILRLGRALAAVLDRSYTPALRHRGQKGSVPLRRWREDTFTQSGKPERLAPFVGALSRGRLHEMTMTRERGRLLTTGLF